VRNKVAIPKHSHTVRYKDAVTKNKVARIKDTIAKYRHIARYNSPLLVKLQL